MRAAIESLYSLLCPLPDEEDATVSYKEKIKVVGIWLFVIAFCIAILIIFLS